MSQKRKKQKTTMRNNLIYILIFLLSGGTVFSQNITIDGNGTVKCPGLPVGYEEQINIPGIGTVTSTVVNNAALIEFRDTGSFTTSGGTTVTPANMSCVCTTRVTDMSSLFLIKEHLMKISQIGTLLMWKICMNFSECS